MIFRLFSAAALFFFFFLSGASAAEFSGRTVTRIIYKDDLGNPWPKPEYLTPLAVVEEGHPLSNSDVRAGIEYLYLKGQFKDIRIDGFPEDGGVRLEYTLVPITKVQSAVIRGNRSISSRAISDAARGIEGGELREERLSELRAAILAIYESAGFFLADVKFRQEEAESPNHVILFIEIDEGRATLIEEISFSGNTVFTGEELLKTIKSRRGMPLKRDVLLDSDIQALVKKYTNAGYPAAKPGPVSLTFRDNKAYVYIPGNEGPRVNISFTGNREFSSGTLKRNLLIWSEHDISDSVIEGSVDRIKGLYRQKGYAATRVEVKRLEGQGRLDLEFSVNEGPKTGIEEIFIQGNLFFTERQIRKQMNTRESGWLAFRPYVEDILEKDVEGIREMYIDSGFLSANVKRRVEMSGDGTEAFVMIELVEGPQTRVGGITFEGNRAFPSSELLGMLSLGTGSPFSERLTEEDRYRILSAYSNKGYLYAKVDVEKIRRTVSAAAPDDASRSGGASLKAPGEIVDVTYRITEDLPVLFGRVILRGNETTKDEVILREVMAPPNSPYDYQAILKSQQRLYRLGFFGMARFETVHPGEKELVKDMLLTVEERDAGAVEMGVGYGDVDRLRGFIEVSHRNIQGRARYASIRLEASDIAERVIFNFREPWFLGYNIENRFSLAWSDTKELNFDTREVYYQRRGTLLSYGFEKVYDSLRASLTYQFDNAENYNVKPDAVITPEDIGHVRVISITPGLVWDLRDDPFNPTRGSLHGFALKEAMRELGSEADFSKATAQSSWFFTLGASLIAAVSGRAGMAWPHGETGDIPLHERFKLGGSTTVRGYVHNSVGPVTGPENTPVGGTSMAVFNVELRTNPGTGFGWVLFTDGGNVWADQDIRLDDLRASYGAGLRYNTPIGPLRVDYGQKIHRRPGESPGEIHFNIGHSF